MNLPRSGGAHHEKLLYELLPALYRARDTAGELKTFVELFEHAFGRLYGNLDQLWRDFYIDSCQDWVIPYHGDLVGTNILFNEGARNRIDVKNTIRWRRKKGTLAGLEEIAADISGWGAHGVEMFERLVWNQNLNHIRLGAEATVPLSQASRLARFDTPFESETRTIDLRQADCRQGWHRIQQTRFALWSIPSHPWRGAQPTAQPALPGPAIERYRFDPLGRDRPLYAGGDKGTRCDGSALPVRRPDICFENANDTPIRARDFHDHAQFYFGQPLGFSVYEDGILLCRTHGAAPSTSTEPLSSDAELHPVNGMKVADESLFGPGAFRIDAVRLAGDPAGYSTLATLAENLQVAGIHGTLDTAAFTYSAGIGFFPAAPDFHHAVTLLRIERLGVAANFPECELILRNRQGQSLLVFLPALAGLALGQPLPLYVGRRRRHLFRMRRARCRRAGPQSRLRPRGRLSAAASRAQRGRAGTAAARRAAGRSSRAGVSQSVLLGSGSARSACTRRGRLRSRARTLSLPARRNSGRRVERRFPLRPRGRGRRRPPSPAARWPRLR